MTSDGHQVTGAGGFLLPVFHLSPVVFQGGFNVRLEKNNGFCSDSRLE